jgi:hypothetical protein
MSIAYVEFKKGKRALIIKETVENLLRPTMSMSSLQLTSQVQINKGKARNVATGNKARYWFPK